MAPPLITAASRYTARGLTKVYWVPTIASTASPTRSELNAGTDLSPQVADSSGWSVKANTIDAPDLSTRYTATIPGMIAADDSSLTFYMSKNGVDARALMPRDAVGNIVWMDGGDVASNKMDVYPVTVIAVSKNRSVQGSDPDTIEISYSITSQPVENVTVP
jgi:hypothetical protein